MQIQLLIIDAQNDFCDLPDAYGYKPTLPVAGAHEDCLRLGRFIRQSGGHITSVVATLDSHHPVDMAHNTNWLDKKGRIVPAFSQVTADDLSSGRMRPAADSIDHEGHAYLLCYLQELEHMGRTLTLWPPHCQIGSAGHNLHSEISTALADWELLHFKPVLFVNKGENIWTESFSALKAVISRPDDSVTQLNRPLLDLMANQDRVLVSGQAASHCVRETVEDILLYGDAGMAKKLTLLTDCTSPVPGFEAETAAFFERVKMQGVRLATSLEVMGELAHPS